MNDEEIENLQKKLEENIFALAGKNKEIKRLKEEIEKSKDPQLREKNKKLKELNEKDQKEIDGLLEKIFNLQTTLSKQAEEIRLLKEENKKLKQVSDGGNQISEAKSNNAQNDDIPEEPPESDDTYEINFRYNNKTFGRRFLSVNTIGQVKAYVKSKTGLSNIYLFTPFPRKVYDDDDALLLDVGLSKRELLIVG